MIIIDNDKIVKNNDDTVRVLITSFPNIVSDLRSLITIIVIDWREKFRNLFQRR